VSDEELLARAERALTEIKVNHGLSEDHAAVLAALRIRLKGSDAKSLEEMLAAAGDDPQATLEQTLADAEREPKPSLDDLFAEEPKPKPDWPS
jgi:Arc/MetJ family transcription regulator